ncbi:MAG: magnesium/cobalt transporter CorA [Candidatus Omnitrophica bacterium]|nr:magnesium/cobalt transporter CorA [Candidatus Omnitrophota bacterium]
MPKFFKKASKQAGLPPGTLVHIGERKAEHTRISIIDYNETEFKETEVKNIEECFPFKETPTTTWINIDGLHDISLIEKIGKCYGLHPLILEDIVNTSQRPKYEDFQNYLYIVVKMLSYDEKEKEIKVEQVSIILGPNYVISFQEIEGDIFDPIRQRIRNAKGRIRSEGADYLAYSLLDTIVDNYFIVLEQVGERIERIEEEVLGNPTPHTLSAINNLKSDAIFLRKAVWPLRDVISGLERSESPLIRKGTRLFLRDVYDHAIQVIDSVETFRDMISGKLDIYLSSMSNKMNEVMKVLTIIATIFIPITFVAGIYGMNFDPDVSRFNMPELSWKYGYIGAWIVMIVMALIMVYYFKRKKWI